MDDARLMGAFLRLFDGLPRYGPGDDEVTREIARSLASETIACAADLGCGNGRSARLLAETLSADVVAVDLLAQYLAALPRARRPGAPGRLAPLRADMAQLPFAPDSFDLLWSEGAIYSIGFEAGLRAWRPLLRERGLCVVSEAVWWRDDPPEEARRFWEQEYPDIGSVEDKRAAARRAGYVVERDLPLPQRGWTEAYYAPLKARALSIEDEDDEAMGLVVESVLKEIEVFERFGDSYGYAFFVLRAA
jgi:serine/threonine-protein kinase HipA